MRKRSINIRIPEPCHEDWNKMTPQEQGRHCASCDKVVTDFTGMSDRQIIEFLQEGRGSGCGRMNPRQLSGPITAYETERSWFSPVAIALSTTLAIFTSSKTFGQESSTTGGVEMVEGEHSQIKTRPTPIKNQFRGKVTDSQTGEPLPFVNVMLTNSGMAGITNFDGLFSIQLMPNEREHLEVTITYLGYLTETFCPADPDSFQNIQLTPAECSEIRGVRPDARIAGMMVLGDVYVVESPPKSFARKVGRVISWPYRRIRSAIRGW